MENPPNYSIYDHSNNPESSNERSRDSSENPYVNVEISNENIQINSFSFEIEPAWTLEFAIRALCDSTFNPKGFALIYAWFDCFYLVVRNSETKVDGSIAVIPNDKTKYWCRMQLFQPKMINLKSVLSVFDNADSLDTVTIRHVYGSTQLLFSFETNVEFGVELTEPDSRFGNVRAYTIACDTMISTQILVEMIPRMVEDGTPQQVFVRVKDKDLTFIVGIKKWEDTLQPIGENSELNSAKEHCVLFQWPHIESLRNAVVLHRSCRFRFESSDVPPGTLQLSFFVTEGCRLIFTRFNSCFKIYTFEFQVKLAPPLRCALRSLTDADFTLRHYSDNEVRIGWSASIEVNNEGCEITVQDIKSKISAFLRFKACDLINFKCTRPLRKKKIDIKQIGLNVLQQTDGRILSVYHVDGSNELSYGCAKQYYTSFNQLDADFVVVPLSLNYACTLELPSEELRKLIPLLVENKIAQTVSLEIKDGNASFSIKERKLATYNDIELLGQNHHVTFEWPHPVALMLASESSKHFLLHLQYDPSDSMILEFDLQVGTLLYRTDVKRFGHATVVRKS